MTPAGALAAGSTTTTSSQITPTAPARLTTPSATPTTVTSTSTDNRSATLPNTGYDLLPETLIGVALVGVGVGLRFRRSRA